MNKSINQWCFPAEWSWDKLFKVAGRAGFQAVELCVDYAPFFEVMAKEQHEGLVAEIGRSVGSTFGKGKALTFDSPESTFKEVKEIASDNGVAVSSLLTFAQFYYTLMHPDEKIWNTGVDLVMRLMDFALVMGAPSLLVVPGLVTSKISYDYGYKRLEEAFWKLKEVAEKKKVGLGRVVLASRERVVMLEAFDKGLLAVIAALSLRGAGPGPLFRGYSRAEATSGNERPRRTSRRQQGCPL